MAETYVIPPVGTKGVFLFKAPFDKTDKIGKNEELTVSSIRSLFDLTRSNEAPYETIYTPMGLTTEEYRKDLDSNIPILVLTRTNGDFYYVPANRVSKYPEISGYVYRRMLLAANLGSLPISFVTDTLTEAVKDAIYNTTGIDTEVVIKPSGAITYLSDEDNEIFMRTLKNKATVDKSYSVLLQEANNTINKQKEIIKSLEDALHNK